MVNKDEVIARALKHHSKTGRVLTALNSIFSTDYPEGTNLVLKFAEMFKGLPYGHFNMCMDKKVDCAEFWRIIYYIWFGIDLGNFSDAVYCNRLGTTITTDYRELSTKCRPLDLTFYHTNRNKKTGHVSGIFDSTKQLMSGASINLGKVGFTGFKWHRSIFVCAKRYLTDEQIAGVTVQAADTSKSVITVKPTIAVDSNTGTVVSTTAGPSVVSEVTYTRLLKIAKPFMNGKDILEVQTKLKEQGYYSGGLDGIYGPETYKAVTGFQKKNGLTADGVTGPKTWTELIGQAAIA